MGRNDKIMIQPQYRQCKHSREILCVSTKISLFHWAGIQGLPFFGLLRRDICAKITAERLFFFHGQGDTRARPAAALKANFIMPLCGHAKITAERLFY
ncbi:hypothetical protein, partial [Anaerotruncus colihominis]|uniref:hypothetical protein n=1 Tax=Anaerotruncus colihominis TaxID=169435 RepID=UPI00194E07AE